MDETDDLLDRFLEVASGERTDATRTRYATALEALRSCGPSERSSDPPGTRLLMRIPRAVDGLDQMQARDPKVWASAPGLWQRLVVWLRRTTDVGDGESRCVLIEAQDRLRRELERRYHERYAYPSWAPEPADDDEPGDGVVTDGAVVLPMRWRQ